MWSRDLGIRLDLVRWETHAYPGFGDDPQSVINDQIADEYDLFIGLMWYRFGTATPRAGSGTIEEFNRAKKMFDRDRSRVQLMIYFKDAPAPIPPTKIDNQQLAKVAEFRASLGTEGGLYWSFTSIDDFERKVRLHLTRQVQAWRSKNQPSQGPTMSCAPAEKKPPLTPPETDEPGLFDLIEQFEDDFSSLREIAGRIGAATEEVGNKMRARTQETDDFLKGAEAADRQAAKRLIARAAADMDQYVRRMEAELPLFSKHLNSGMDSLVRAASISAELKPQGEGLDQIKYTLGAIRQFRETLSGVEGQFLVFQNSVASLPRMTTVLNRAKRAVVGVLDRLINEFRAAQTMAGDAESSFTLILDREN